MSRFSRPDETTFRTFGRLAPRHEVPAKGAWNRLYAGPKRKANLMEAFSEQAVEKGEVLALIGPPETGKSTAALALCDLRGLRAVYATLDSKYPALKPASGFCVIIDSISSFERPDVAACVKAYRGTTPVILVGQNQLSLQGIEPDIVISLKKPSPSAITSYLQTLLEGYQTSLTTHDLKSLAEQLEGLSYPQINQVTVDAALSRLQVASPIDAPAFAEALQGFRDVQRSKETR